MLQAVAHAQTDTGAPVIIHPGRSSEAPDEIVRILQEAGGDISKTVMSHLDSMSPTSQTWLAIIVGHVYKQHIYVSNMSKKYLMDKQIKCKF